MLVDLEVIMIVKTHGVETYGGPLQRRFGIGTKSPSFRIERSRSKVIIFGVI